MTHQTCVAAFTLASAALIYGQALAVDQDVSSDIIAGDGIANGGFTVDQNAGIELGLRGKLRFDSNNQPQNLFNSNNAGTYTFEAGYPAVGFSWQVDKTTTPFWNFDWSINTDYASTDATSTNQLDDYDYVLSLDADPSAGTNFLSFDPINVDVADHGIGTNLTANGAGDDDNPRTDLEYAALIAANYVAQNSWSYEFFNHLAPLDTFDPSVNGLYTIKLEAFAKGTVGTAGPLASTSIDINVVPEPASLALLGLGGLCLLGRRRRNA